MRVLGWMVLVLCLPGRVWAAPEPPPPGDYPGAQYIDRTGCVFLRDGDHWSPRLDKQGTPICGFPPSQAANVPLPETPPSPEEVLTAVLAEGLRTGDLATDEPRKPLADVPPDPAQADLDATLASQVELDNRLRSAMAGPAPEGLCARLGYRPAGDTPPHGVDVTQGLCSGMVADSPAPTIVSATAAPPEVSPMSDERPAPVERAAATAVVRPDKPVKPKHASVVARRSAPQSARPPSVEMIAAGARYVQIGTYADEANALAALRRLSGMGYRTAQRHQRADGPARRAILAGPFTDRQALVTALTRLRASGYPRAIAQ